MTCVLRQHHNTGRYEGIVYACRQTLRLGRHRRQQRSPQYDQPSHQAERVGALLTQTVVDGQLPGQSSEFRSSTGSVGLSQRPSRQLSICTGRVPGRSDSRAQRGAFSGVCARTAVAAHLCRAARHDLGPAACSGCASLQSGAPRSWSRSVLTGIGTRRCSAATSLRCTPLDSARPSCAGRAAWYR